MIAAEAMAQLFAREGAKLVLAGRRLERLQETATDIAGEAQTIRCDVTKERQVVAMVEAAVARFDHVDISLNNSTQPGKGLFSREQTPKVWNADLAVDVTGPMLCTREMLHQSISPHKSGSIINFSYESWQGKVRKRYIFQCNFAPKVASDSLGEHCMDKVRVGIIGANSERGWSSRAHLPAVTAHPDLELVAVCTTQEKSVRLTAERYGVPHAVTKASDLVALSDVDLVIVSTKAPTHVEHVRLAIEAGKNVFCEWPLGSNCAESAALEALAAARGVRNFIGMQGAQSPACRYARDLLADGRIGEIISCTMIGNFMPWGAKGLPGQDYLFDAEAGVSIATIPSGHGLDMLCSLVGEFKQVSGLVATRYTETLSPDQNRFVPKSSPDQLAAAGLLQSGAVTAIHMQGGALDKENFFIDVRGTSGTLRISTVTIPELLPQALFVTNDVGILEPVSIPDAYRVAPLDLGEGTAVNVYQLLDLVVGDLRNGTADAPDFAHALKRRRVLDTIATARLIELDSLTV